MTSHGLKIKRMKEFRQISPLPLAVKIFAEVFNLQGFAEMDFDMAILFDDAIDCAVTSHGPAAVEGEKDDAVDAVTCAVTSDFADDVDDMQSLIDDAIACSRHTDNDVRIGRKRPRIATPCSGDLRRSACHMKLLRERKELRLVNARSCV